MYVIKMKTLIYYFAIFAVTLAGIGIIKLCSYGTSIDADSMLKESPSPQSSAMLFDKAKSDEKDVPIIMYHSILRSSHSGSEYIISEADFERDLKFLKKQGYTPIVMQDLIDFVDGKGTLPEKPIILTFDDGYFNNCSYAFPLLKKYDCKAVISIIGYYTDLYTETPDENPAYSHLTWKDIKEMIASGNVEFQNHSYNLHTIDKGRNGTKKKKGESLADYKAILTSDLGKLQDAFKDEADTWMILQCLLLLSEFAPGPVHCPVPQQPMPSSPSLYWQ